MSILVGWTDYPIEDFGDEPHIEAPIRQCEIVDYDGDKYVEVKVYDRGNVAHASIKHGYVYRRRARSGEPYSHDTLMDVFG